MLQPSNPAVDWCVPSPAAGSKPVNGSVEHDCKTSRATRIAFLSERSKKAHRSRKRMLEARGLKKRRSVWDLVPYL